MSCLEILVNLASRLLKFLRRLAIKFAGWDLEIGGEVDGMLYALWGGSSFGSVSGKTSGNFLSTCFLSWLANVSSFVALHVCLLGWLAIRGCGVAGVDDIDVVHIVSCMAHELNSCAEKVRRLRILLFLGW